MWHDCLGSQTSPNWSAPLLLSRPGSPKMDIFQRKHLSSIISGHNKNDLRWHWNREIQSALSEKWFFFSIGWIFAHLSWLMKVQVQVHLKMLTGWTAHLSHRLFSAEGGRVRSPFALRPFFLSIYLSISILTKCWSGMAIAPLQLRKGL